MLFRSKRWKGAIVIFSRSAVVLKRGGEERRNGGENGEREVRWRTNGDGEEG